MIQLQKAGKRFGHKLLFEDCDWLITPRERTGLVGANGTGKSTLLKILAGKESLDYGQMTAMKGITQGYLPQDGLTLSGKTVFAECMSVFADLREMERELETLLAETEADEIIATAQIFDHAARLRSFEIAAQVFGEINAGCRQTDEAAAGVMGRVD